MQKAAVLGAGLGTGIGATAGSVGMGTVGGFVGSIVPGAGNILEAAGGTALGGWGGGAIGGGVGYVGGLAIGYSACMSSNGGTGGGGGAAKKETPTSNPGKFRSIRGTAAKLNTETGEVWVKDPSQHGGEHYEVYKNQRDFQNGVRGWR